MHTPPPPPLPLTHTTPTRQSGISTVTEWYSRGRSDSARLPLFDHWPAQGRTHGGVQQVEQQSQQQTIVLMVSSVPVDDSDGC